MLEHKSPNQLPVPTNVIPAETRLAGILPELKKVVDKAGKHRNLRLSNIEVLAEAFQYTPPFSQKIAGELLSIRPLLISRGFPPRITGNAELDKMVSEALDGYSSEPRPVKEASLVSEITGKVFRTFHPDVAGTNVTQVFSDSERTDILLQASKVSRHKDVEAVQELLLEAMPMYYIFEIERMLKQGMSLSEIVVINPQLVPDLEQIMWVAAQKFSKEKPFGLFQNPEEAKREAFRIKRKSNQYDRYVSFGAIYTTVEDIVVFAKLKGLVPELAANFDALLQYMEETGELVGETDVLSHYKGNSSRLPEVRRIQEMIERYMEAIPARVQNLAKIVVFSNSAPDFERATEELRSAVASVRGSSEDSVEQLIDYIKRRGSSVNPDFIKALL